jgi:prolyl-tRNA synthetase
VTLWSEWFIPTLRDEPAESDPSLRLLIRAGYLRRVPRGFAYLPLARRMLRKIVQIAREEMDAIGGQEFHVKHTDLTSLTSELKSYKQVQQIWYWFEDGLESLSVDLAEERSFRLHESAFRRILERCGVSWLEDAESVFEPEEFATPGIKSIAEIAAFTGLPETSQIKSLVMIASESPVMALLRGDQQLSEAKLSTAIDASEIRTATSEEIHASFGADAGSLGPVGVKGVRIVADYALCGRRNMICGANKNDFHLRNVTPEEDFTAAFADLERDESSDIFRSKGNRHWLSLERLVFAIAEQHHDKDGLTLPETIAPFTAVVTPVFYSDETQQKAAAEICSSIGDVLLDDRDERPGVKFKDADLIGMPYRINIGKKLAQGLVEVVERATKQVTDVPIANVSSHIRRS